MSSEGIDPGDTWLWCPGCDIEFIDPFAELKTHDTLPDRVVGECECGATIKLEVES